MLSDMTKFFLLTTVLALSVLVADAGPCFSRTAEPDPVIHLAAGPGRHVIKSGDTINLLARRYGVPAAAILKANPGLNPSRLQLGREIVIPAAGHALSDAPAAAAAPTIELRPEKAPQATPPTGALKEHDLSDGAVKAPAAPAGSKAQPAPAVPADGAKASAGDTPADNAAKPRTTESGRPAIEDIWPMQPPAGNASAAARTMPEPRDFFHGAAAWFLAILIAIALVVGLALQGILSSFAAGCALRLLCLFKVGDAVVLAGIAGKVESLGWFYVVIRAEGDETVLVPNAKALSEIMVVAAARAGQ